MSKAVPHFTEDWLKEYNARLQAANRKTREKRESTESPANAPTRATTASDGTFIVHTPSKRVPVPCRAYDGKQTETEKRYNANCLNGTGRFEAVCLYLPGGGRYTPDFMTIDDGRVTFHEVKGSYRLQSQGRALTAFQEAAAAFPIFDFVWATETKTKGEFEIKKFDCLAIDEGNV